MTMRSPGTMLRVGVMVAAGLLVVWSVPYGGQLALACVALAAVAVWGLVVRPGGIRWYILGGGLVLACVFLGIKDGPFDVATTGYCDSVFEPGYSVVEDAPAGTYERCDEVRRERIPIVAGLALSGLAALVMSSPRRRRTHRDSATAQ